MKYPMRQINFAVRSAAPGNADRAQRGLAMCKAHQAYTSSGETPCAEDMLADLMHYCKAIGVDFNAALENAIEHFDTEVEDADDEV